MKQNLTNIPEVDINDVNAFYVVGSTHKDGILGNENYKLNLKSLGGGGGIDLNDRAALRKLYSAMLDAVSLVLITEDLCVYNDDPSSPGKGTYTVLFPELPALPGSMDVTYAVSGLFKDTLGNTHNLETLKLQWAPNDHKLVGEWQESNTDYILTIEPVSDTEGRMSIARELSPLG